MSYFTFKMNDDYMPHDQFDAEIKQLLWEAAQDYHDARQCVQKEIHLYPKYQLIWNSILLLQ